MGISVRSSGHVRIIEVTGEVSVGGGGIARPLDLRGSPLEDLGTAIRASLDQDNPRILLDLAGVRFMDSAGLGELVSCAKRAVERGGDIRILRPGPKIRELFAMTGLNRVFRVFETESEAVASFTP